MVVFSSSEPTVHSARGSNVINVQFMWPTQCPET